MIIFLHSFAGGPSFTDNIQAVEFYIKNRESGIRDILESHHLTTKSIVMISMTVVAGVYPQYAILDQYNHYKVTSLF